MNKLKALSHIMKPVMKVKPRIINSGCKDEEVKMRFLGLPYKLVLITCSHV